MRNCIAAVAVLALAACGVNTAKVTAEGQKLVEQFGPQVAALAKDGEALAARLKALPAEFPGVADLVSRVTAHQGQLAALRSKVQAFPDDLAAVIQVGKEADILATLEKFKKEVSDELAAAGPRLKDLSGQLAALQAKVAAGGMSAAAPGAPAK